MRAAVGPVVLACAAILCVNYMDRGTLSVAAPMMQKDLGISDEALGTLLSAFFWSYTLMQIPIGWLAERYGGHRVLAGGLAIWAAATLLTGTVTSFAMLVALRMLLGFGESAGFPCMSKVLAQTVPPSGLGFANGIIGFAYLFGPAVGSVAAGRLIDSHGWRSVFIVFGALSLALLIPWALVGPRVRAARAAAAGEDSPSFRDLLKTKALWGTGLGLFSSNYAFYFMLTWLPSYLVRERGFSTLEMSNINGIAFLINALSALAVGWGSDRLINRGASTTLVYKSVMGVAHAGTVVCLLGMALAGKPVALGCLYLYQALCGASSPGVYAISQILSGSKAAGRWVGVQNTMGSFAGVVSPYVTGRIIASTGSFINALLVASAIAALGLVGWVWMLPKLEELHWKRTPQRAATPALT